MNELKKLNKKQVAQNAYRMIIESNYSTTDKKNAEKVYKKWERIISYLGEEYGIQERFLRQFYNAYREELNDPHRTGEDKSFYPIGYLATKSSLLDIYEKLIKYNFDYTPNFYGLRNLLEEVSIDPKMVSLYIDNERNTFESAKNWGFKDIKNVDSLTNSGVRISDFLSNFVGRFIYAITNDENMKEDKVQYFKDIYTNNLVTKRLLSDEWFDLSKG